MTITRHPLRPPQPRHTHPYALLHVFSRSQTLVSAVQNSSEDIPLWKAHPLFDMGGPLGPPWCRDKSSISGDNYLKTYLPCRYFSRHRSQRRTKKKRNDARWSHAEEVDTLKQVRDLMDAKPLTSMTTEKFFTKKQAISSSAAKSQLYPTPILPCCLTWSSKHLHFERTKSAPFKLLGCYNTRCNLICSYWKQHVATGDWPLQQGCSR